MAFGQEESVLGRRSSTRCRGYLPPSPGIAAFDAPLPGFQPSEPFMPCQPTLPTYTGEADLPPSTRIERGETCVRITFCPTLQDQSAFSSSGIMADFVVQYDVVMEDIIGDVQVRGPRQWEEYGLWSHTGPGNNLASTSCSFGSP